MGDDSIYYEREKGERVRFVKSIQHEYDLTNHFWRGNLTDCKVSLNLGQLNYIQQFLFYFFIFYNV